MKKYTIETLIQGLRVRSTSNTQGRLDNILDAHDQWRRQHTSALRVRRLRMRWGTGLMSAAIITLVISLTVTRDTPRHTTGQHGRTMAVHQYQINTAASLRGTFCQEGLEGLERQLDRAFELYGPGPGVSPKYDLF